MKLELQWMTSGDVDTIVAASYLFDDDVNREWTERFLRQPNHHMCIAYDDEEQLENIRHESRSESGRGNPRQCVAVPRIEDRNHNDDTQYPEPVAEELGETGDLSQESG